LLEALHIEDCNELLELPAMSAITRLTSLMLQEGGFTELPCFGGMTALRLLSLKWHRDLMRLLSSIDKLTDVRELNLVDCRHITDLPSIGRL